jgi:hypothetical protein
MNTNESTKSHFDEQKSIQVIREMLKVSQKRLKNDGILFIVWGWIMFYVYLAGFIESKSVMTFMLKKTLAYSGYMLGIAGILFTLVYIIRQHKKVQTYIGISLRYVWTSMVLCLVLINLIQFNVLHKIIFELQHPIFMVVIAFAIVITGGILRHKLIITGGIVFAALAYCCSYIPLEEQLMVEAIAWLAAFIIPGHILYSTRKN